MCPLIHKQELYEDLIQVYDCIDSCPQHSKYILKQIIDQTEVWHGLELDIHASID